MQDHYCDHLVTFFFGSWQVEVTCIWHFVAFLIDEFNPLAIEFIRDLWVFGSEDLDVVSPAKLFFCAILSQVVTVAYIASLLIPLVRDLDSQTVHWEPFWDLLV